MIFSIPLHRKNAGKFLPYFALKEGEAPATIRFLDDKPLTFYQHRVFDAGLKQGQGGHRNLTCMRQDCPLCKAGNKPRYVGAYRIIHIDSTEKNGTVAPKEKIFLKGVNALAVLDKKNQKKRLTSENMEVERIGDGFDTQYIFEWTGEKKVPKNYTKPDEDDLKEIFAINEDDLIRLAKNEKRKGRSEEDEEEDPAPKSKGKGKKGKKDEDEDLPF
jgi:hypothetical protein